MGPSPKIISSKNLGSKRNKQPGPKPFVLGVCGSSGSGKTTFVNQLTKTLDSKDYVVLEQDNYYKDLSHLTLQQRAMTNFDHPNSLDLKTFGRDLKALCSRKTITSPQYDFTQHKRTTTGLVIEPRPIIIVLGILLFTNPQIVEQLDLKLFIETDSDLCLERRVRRDTTERGRNVTDVLNQYLHTVKPMFDEFVAPSKKFADIVIPFNQKNSPAIDLVHYFLRSRLLT